jgi:hypothetical protein
VIPRSTSVVVKRMPPARPGKGKAAMYIAAPGTSATPESRPGSQAGGSSWPSRGSLSRRFDKDVSSTKPAAVRISQPRFFRSLFCPYAFEIHAGPRPKSGWQGRRGGRDGRDVPGSVRELGGDSGKNVTVGVAFGGSSRVL